MTEYRKNPDIYEAMEKEAKRLGIPKESIVTRNIQPITVQDSPNCRHDFRMEGLYSIKCQNCGWGLAVAGVKDAQNLIERLTKKE